MKKISISKKIIFLSACLLLCFFSVAGLGAENNDKNKLVEMMDVMLEDFLNPVPPDSTKTQTAETAEQKTQPADTASKPDNKTASEQKPSAVEPIAEKPVKPTDLPKPVETAVPEHIPIVEEYITLENDDDTEIETDEVPAEKKPDVVPETKTVTDEGATPKGAATSEADTKPKTPIVTETETKPKTQITAERESKSKSETITESESKPKTESETKPKAQTITETETKPKTETATKTETKQKPQPVAETEAKPKTETATKTETKQKTQPVTETESKPKTETATKTETKQKPQPVAETEAKPKTETAKKTETKQKPQTVTETETKPKTETATKTETKQKTQPVAETEAKPKTETAKKTETKQKPQTVTETETKPKTKSLTEVEKTPDAKTSKIESADKHEEILFEDDDEIVLIGVEEDMPVPVHVEIETEKKAPKTTTAINANAITQEAADFDPFLFEDEPDFIFQPYVALDASANKTNFSSAMQPIIGGNGLIQNFGMNIQYEKLIKPTISLGIVGGGTYNFKKDNKIYGMRLGLTGRKYFQTDSFRNLPYGFFLQGELGASAAYSNGSFIKDTYLNSKISPMGMLKIGYRAYLLKSPMYFEPFIRGGYPLTVSAGITFGTNW